MGLISVRVVISVCGFLDEGGSEMGSSDFFLLSRIASFCGRLREVGGWISLGIMS